MIKFLLATALGLSLGAAAVAAEAQAPTTPAPDVNIKSDTLSRAAMANQSLSAADATLKALEGAERLTVVVGVNANKQPIGVTIAKSEPSFQAVADATKASAEASKKAAEDVLKKLGVTVTP
jgi:hypothetical protein